MPVSSTKPKPGRHGGPRPGAGPKRKVQNARSLVFFAHPDTIAALDRLTEDAAATVKEANMALAEKERDVVITRSEIVRVALETYCYQLSYQLDVSSIEALVRRYRPYLGAIKPPGTDGPPEGRRERVVTVVPQALKDFAKRVVDEANAVIRYYNRRLERKSDYDPVIAMSELYREALDDFLRTYEGRGEALAHDLRPRLGKRKRV